MVIVMDIAMPLLNGLEATRQILKDFPATKIIILSAHSDDAYVEQVTDLGAMGFLLKQSSSKTWPQPFARCKKEIHFFSPAYSKRLKDRDRKR